MNEPSVPTIRKFNPGLFQSDRDVIEQFVVRHHELDAVLDILRGNVEAPSCQHVLIVAPRGRGKTMLLARAAAELRADEQLSAHLLPVRFMEESHEIFRLADFWLETLFYLAREVAGPDPDLSRELRDTHADLKSRWRERELADRARAAVLEAAERLDRRLVLMVENLQTLCESVDDDFGWGLRQALQSEPRIVLVATATSRFEALEDARQPFFELFRTIPLRPLDTEDCRHLWQAAGGGDRSAWSIRPLEILTGGNPRLLVIVAGFARHRSLRQLMDELVTLIDDHTEYFRNHLEGLAKTERRVYLATIDLWEPATPGEIAARAALDVRIVSTMLGRLVERGAITVEGSGRKRLYAAAERLYCVYYKLRRERDEAAVVQGLIRFMAVFYGDGELKELSGPLRLEAARFPAFREGIERALAQMPDTEANVFRSAVFPGEGRRAIEGGDRQARESGNEAWGLRSWVASASALVDKGRAQMQRGDAEAAIVTWDEVVDRFGADEAPELRSQVAWAMLGKGFAQGQLGDAEAAVKTCDEVVDRFSADEAPELRPQVAWTMINKVVVQGQLGDAEAVVKTCDEVVDRFGADEAPELRSQVAWAMVNKGFVQNRLGDTRAAVKTWDEIVDRFGADEAPELRSQVALAMVNKADAQRKLGDAEAAVKTCNEVVDRFSADEGPKLQWHVAQVLINKGLTQEQLGDAEAAIKTYDEVVERFSTDEEPKLQWHVAEALINKGLAQEQLGDAEAAVKTYDEVVDRFGADETPELQLHIAQALVNKGFAQMQIGDAEAAVKTCDEVVDRFGADETPELQLHIAQALVNKGFAQMQIGDAEAAVKTCDEVVDRFGADETPELRSQIAWAWVWFRWLTAWVRTEALLAMGQREAAVDAFRTAYHLFDPENEGMMGEMLRFVLRVIAAGFPERDLVGVLAEDRGKADALAPLLVALRQRTGESVRAPAEVLEVAGDIRRQIDETEAAERTYPVS